MTVVAEHLQIGHMVQAGQGITPTHDGVDVVDLEIVGAAALFASVLGSSPRRSARDRPHVIHLKESLALGTAPGPLPAFEFDIAPMATTSVTAPGRENTVSFDVQSAFPAHFGAPACSSRHNASLPLQGSAGMAASCSSAPLGKP